ncbi:MAG TPA: YfhO family protein [Candidatus Dormibacteraeota bacterium]|nr:YfhO family protein [Candidatus Dormibacteraeota bacterium]
MAAELNRMPAILTGIWADLNWLGNPGVSPAPTVSTLLRVVTSAVWFAKLYAPFSVWFLGICSALVFRQFGLRPAACVLGGLAVTLNSNFLSSACWGVCSHPITFGAAYLAVGAVAGTRSSWKGVLLAGIFVGIAIMEGYDIGAIFSLYIAVFALFHVVFCEERPRLPALPAGIIRIAVIAIVSALVSAHTLSSLISTQVKGATGEEENMTPAQRWDWATQWSMPPAELPRILIPGLFGYRMDTPKDVTAFGELYQGGVYWGSVGRAPILDSVLKQYHAEGHQGSPPGIPDGAWRFNGGGEYTGVLVVMVAVWAFAQSLRKTGSAFTIIQRRLIWFWSGAAVISLLFALGRYAPFYKLFYLLPHASNIRNASKFMHPFHWSLLVVFAYGLHGLFQRYFPVLDPIVQSGKKRAEPIKPLVPVQDVFDRRFKVGSFVFAAASLIGLLIYSSSRESLQNFIMSVGFGDPAMAAQIAAFSVKEFGWFVFFTVASVVLLALIISGRFNGRVKWAVWLVGGLLLVDLVRADLPWILYQNYVERYRSDAVLDFLREKPYEHRVILLPVANLPPEAKPIQQLADQLAGLVRIEWMQHQFQYYNIQCLEDVQRPRESSDFKAYERGPVAATPLRHWELTNTKYFLGPAALRTSLEGQTGGQFKDVLEFDMAAKPGVMQPRSFDEMMAVPATNGQYAVYSYTKALPRVGLYTDWHVQPDDKDCLTTLASPGFDPHKLVMVAEHVPLAGGPSTNAPEGTATIISYKPKRLIIEAKASAPSVLLLNDKFDPDWKVTVDGKPQTLLRCNYLMQGVALAPGNHAVEFSFRPRLTWLFVSLAALVASLAGVTVLGVATRSDKVISQEKSGERRPPGS